MIRVPVSGLKSGIIRLDAATSRYLVKVHRLTEGDELEVFSPVEGLVAHAQLVGLKPQAAELEVASVRASTEKLPDVTLIQCVGKNDKPEEAVKDATVYGARTVIFAISQRSVAKAQGSGRLERWRRISADAARQCQRDSLPEIHIPRALQACLESLEDDPKEVRLVCAWHETSVPLLSALNAVSWAAQRVTLLIGPEGGLSPPEVATAIQQGFLPVSLGPLILRTEAATSLSLAACALCFAQSKSR